MKIPMKNNNFYLYLLKKRAVKHLMIFLTISGLFGFFAINSSVAITFSLPEEGNVIGQIKKVKLHKGATLFDIAKMHDIGVQEILKHNPGKSLHRALPGGTTVVIPARFVLPSTPKQGIVLNLAHMRLYYYHPAGKKVSTYPVGIGRNGWSTPRGRTVIVGKNKNPTWRPPASLKREAANRGRTLPDSVPPGPRNPLGRYAFYLGFRSILIHGTLQPSTIGTRCSHGCIRMYPHNIQKLFQQAPVGTPVRIVYEPK